jgi:hypothetical protein
MSLGKFLHLTLGFQRDKYFADLIGKIQANQTVADVDFDAIYPAELRKFTRLHFSPIEISRHVAMFLTEEKPQAKILDIGSGAGKFCLIGSKCTAGHFVGIERRASLHVIAEQIAEFYSFQNVEFILDNITQHSLKPYDAFYIFNSFYENISFDENITDEVSLQQPNYDTFSAYVKQELEKMPIGTRLATYFCSKSIAPDSYELQQNTFNENLKLWIKKQ